MKKKLLGYTIPLILGMLLLTACGAGESESSAPSNQNHQSITGTFVDEPVEGLFYTCSSGSSGFTDNKGNYTCLIGDNAEFFIGTSKIGTLAAQSEVITPYSFFPNDLDAPIALARLLQSIQLESDGFIKIDQDLAKLLPVGLDFHSDSFEVDVENAVGIELISEEEATLALNTGVLEAGGEVPQATNHIPESDAGDNQNIITQGTVYLDGSGSTDVDGDRLVYRWSFSQKPDDSTASLSNEISVNPSFFADKDGVYILQLIVNDGQIDSAADTVTITAKTENVKPTANAGVDQEVTTGSQVRLDATDSTDANGDSLSYQWSFTSIPAESGATLASPTSVKPTFTADTDGDYVVQLIVNDGQVNSDPVAITITAKTEGQISSETLFLDDIPILIVKPADMNKKTSLVIFQHGFTGYKEEMRPYLDALAEEGYLAICIDAYEHGARAIPGDNLWNRVFESGNTRSEFWPILGHTADDLVKVMDWAQEEYNLFDKVCMGGFSMGGDISVSLAGVDSRVNCVSGVVTTPDWLRPNSSYLGQQGIANEEAQGYYDRYDPLSHITSFRENVNITFEEGENDTLIPADDAFNFENEAKNLEGFTSTIRVIEHEGLGHGIDINGIMWKNSLQWFMTYSAKEEPDD